MLDRRRFVTTTMALATAGLTAPSAFAKGLDPKDPDIKFGTTGSIFGVWPAAGTQNSISMKMSTNMAMMLADVKQYGRPSAGRAQRRPAQGPGRHRQRDRYAHQEAWRQAIAARPYVGPDGART